MLTAAIIAGLASAAVSGLGAYKSAQANKRNQGLLNNMGDEYKSDYMKEYYRGTLENPGSKAYLKRLDQQLRDRTKATENTAAATGATQENVLAAKQANNEVMSNAVGDLVQNEDYRKQNIKERYFQRKAGLDQAQMGINSQQGQNWATLASNIAGAGSSLANVYLQSGQGFIPKAPNQGEIIQNQLGRIGTETKFKTPAKKY
jgi:hypothetical protein